MYKSRKSNCKNKFKILKYSIIIYKTKIILNNNNNKKFLNSIKVKFLISIKIKIVVITKVCTKPQIISRIKIKKIKV